MSNLLPNTRKLVVGIREMKEVEVYPLSFGQQKKFADKIASALNEFSEKNEEDLAVTDMAQMILTLIEDNIVALSEMVIEGGIDVDNITNDQVVELATIIYEMNYEGASKNVLNLVNRMKNILT
jgi:hypothetical protein